MELEVSIETHYGTRRVYPECEKARLFSYIANTDTLTESMIEFIKELGYTFKVQVPEL
jgi:hypothetical protein